MKEVTLLDIIMKHYKEYGDVVKRNGILFLSDHMD